MGKTAALFVRKEHTQIVGAVGLQSPGSCVGHVAHFPGDRSDSGTGLLADVRLAVQGLADGGNGHTAALGNVFHGYHDGFLLFPFP